MDFYAAYPMTPASSLIDVIAAGFQKINKQLIPEDKKNPLTSSAKSSAIFFQ
jgi:pyruvate/2-oxoacid:ferredoxin oxidoreductase alpha subunit